MCGRRRVKTFRIRRFMACDVQFCRHFFLFFGLLYSYCHHVANHGSFHRNHKSGRFRRDQREACRQLFPTRYLYERRHEFQCIPIKHPSTNLLLIAVLYCDLRLGGFYDSPSREANNWDFLAQENQTAGDLEILIKISRLDCFSHAGYFKL